MTTKLLWLTLGISIGTILGLSTALYLLVTVAQNINDNLPVIAGFWA